MAPNVKCRRYPEAKTFRITGGEVRQACINYVNHTLAVPIQHLYDDHGTISPIDTEESEQKIKQEWSLLDPMVDLFEQI